jgi:ribose 5-phosphate isomerase B
MLICIGSDHLGFHLKEELNSFLTRQGHNVRDFGTTSEEPVDYPDVAASVAEALRAGVAERGILICGTGLGMAIAANKVPGIFAAPVTNVYAARLSRQSNNAHIITLGADAVGFGLACSIVEAWLAVEFCGGESARKVAKISALEEHYRLSDVQMPFSGGSSS